MLHIKWVWVNKVSACAVGLRLNMLQIYLYQYCIMAKTFLYNVHCTVYMCRTNYYYQWSLFSLSGLSHRVAVSNNYSVFLFYFPCIILKLMWKLSFLFLWKKIQNFLYFTMPNVQHNTTFELCRFISSTDWLFI